jgi:hypothetical protein
VDNKIAKDVCAASWGLWGASLVDDAYTDKIPGGIVAQLNRVASDERRDTYPRAYSWDELRRAFGGRVNEIRKSISDGMRIRMASKYLDIPFIMAAELVDRFDDIKPLKEVVAAVKRGQPIVKMVKQAGVVQGIYEKYAKGNHKLAIDEQAKKYYEDYLGPFGKELTREVKKRVRADLAEAWLRKNGVDQKAVDYWSSYFSGGYGADLVKDLAKKLSPK